MSKVDLGALVTGFSGRVGNLVLVRRGNATFLWSRPRKRTSKPSAKEKAQRERFRRATAYARAKMADPAMKAEYAQIAKRKERMTPFTIAVTDYLRAPVIDAIKVEGYTGKVNDIIIAKAIDDFKVVSLKVTITLPTNVVLETGAAIFDATTLEWRYASTKANATLAGTKVKFTGSDRPGNETSLETVM
jgi:hypothetical protein